MLSFTKRLLTLVVVFGSFQVQAECILEGDGFTSQDGGCYNAAQDLVWSKDNPAAGLNYGMPYSFAVNYCANLVEGGFDDWDLPTRQEMQDVAADGAAAHLNYGYSAANSRWSSTLGTGANRKKRAAVSLLDGKTTYPALSSSLFVICVRQP